MALIPYTHERSHDTDVDMVDSLQIPSVMKATLLH